MIIQLSSGQGPAECELAVSKLAKALMAEFPDMTVLAEHRSRFSKELTSITLESEMDLSMLEGSILWVCQSPYRPHHKRKNWFVDVSVIPYMESSVEVDAKDIRFERFHCGGNGGQNVNKVETGVRLTHIPTGLVVTSTSERSQQQNRNDAMRKLRFLLKEQETAKQDEHENTKWREHNRIVRGNPIRTYEGIEFKRTR